jgi:hypothetical protein
MVAELKAPIAEKLEITLSLLIERAGRSGTATTGYRLAGYSPVPSPTG